MGVQYSLINKTKKEKISYSHLPVGKLRELAGFPVSSAITTWYLLKNSGDEIGFLPDQGESPMKGINWEVVKNYSDVTEKVIDELIENGIIEDNGVDIFDEEEPELYIRRLRNIWMET